MNYLCYHQKPVIIDLQADLKWIHQELDNVKDPNLLKAIKNILKDRKNYHRNASVLNNSTVFNLDTKK